MARPLAGSPHTRCPVVTLLLLGFASVLLLLACALGVAARNYLRADDLPAALMLAAFSLAAALLSLVAAAGAAVPLAALRPAPPLVAPGSVR